MLRVYRLTKTLPVKIFRAPIRLLRWMETSSAIAMPLERNKSLAETIRRISDEESVSSLYID